jgi:hypothetical protein
MSQGTYLFNPCLKYPTECAQSAGRPWGFGFRVRYSPAWCQGQGCGEPIGRLVSHPSPPPLESSPTQCACHIGCVHFQDPDLESLASMDPHSDGKGHPWTTTKAVCPYRQPNDIECLTRTTVSKSAIAWFSQCKQCSFHNKTRIKIYWHDLVPGPIWYLARSDLVPGTIRSGTWHDQIIT